MNGRDSTPSSQPMGVEASYMTAQMNPYYPSYIPTFPQMSLRKLFVGQIPKTMKEEEVIKIFSDSFTIYSAYIIRDRTTQEHKGCAFICVDINSADALIEKYHNKYKCDGMTNSLQVKYANTNHPHPNIPVPHPVPVAADGETTTNFSAEMAVAPIMPMVPMTTFPMYGNMVMPIIQQPVNTGSGEGSSKEGETAVNPTSSTEGQVTAQIPMVSTPQYSYYMPSMYSPMAVNSPNAMAPSSPVIQQAAPGYYYYPTSTPYYTASPSYDRPTNRWNSDPEANLFIYNIPPRYSDLDLQNLFAPFGTVLSAKVARNATNGNSKGYGFVNYSTAEEAKKAIAEMHQKTVEGRMLTVQIKKVKG